ncbi:MAG: GNAT family N-acetyltransferase [Candidatus Aenigmarchaeota archaeon]|nr:GNAT family N-acetyltransferase [Candidatus Aenigmarchaeota archaeon]
MEVKYKEVKTISEFIDAIRIRADVFIKEQRFQPGWEPDEDDKFSRHFIAIADGKIVSTARFRETSKGQIKIERTATKKEYRGKGIGKGLLEFMLKKMAELKPKKIILMSQVQSQPFYEKYGFRAVSKPYDMYGVKHIDMAYTKK